MSEVGAGPGGAGKAVARITAEQRMRAFAYMLRVYSGETPECDPGTAAIRGRHREGNGPVDAAAHARHDEGTGGRRFLAVGP
jgi:hypothetical protein